MKGFFPSGCLIWTSGFKIISPTTRPLHHSSGCLFAFKSLKSSISCHQTSTSLLNLMSIQGLILKLGCFSENKVSDMNTLVDSL